MNIRKYIHPINRTYGNGARLIHQTQTKNIMKTQSITHHVLEPQRKQLQESNSKEFIKNYIHCQAATIGLSFYTK